MGIKGLWSVLAPFSEKKSLHEIRGETVAVDLAGWVCDSQNVTEYHIQPKMYLRNLFFRTIYLILADINPIFVLEGDAPELKRDVMAARNAIQFRGAAPKTNTAGGKKPDVTRRRFKNVLKECETLLKCMGVRCIKGQGEAEATCAELNAQGIVHAVISQDSDCFAYGARRVYRNFSVSSSAGGGAMQGSVDCYDADVMFNSNGFGRNKMVALAILCGCDYGVGACGSSIGTAVSFLHTVAENEVIPRLLSWVCDTKHYDELSNWVSAPGRCDRCGHGGRTHLRNGCPVCVTHRGCNDTGHKSKLADVKRELSLRKRALSCEMTFPEPKIMKEFLNKTTENLNLNDLKTPVPNLIQFVKLMSSKLDWSARYCVDKFLPLLTKFHLQEQVPYRTIKPVAIKKKRNPKGVPSYEVVWDCINELYEALIPDDQFEENEDHSMAWVTIERQDLMLKYYPDLVAMYEHSIKKPAKEKKQRKQKENVNPEKPKRKYTKKTKNPVDIVLDETMKNLSLKTCDLNSSKANISISVKKLKRKISKRKGNQKTIDSFITKKRKKSLRKSMTSMRQSFKNMSLCKDNYDLMFDELEGKENINVKKNYLANAESLLNMTDINKKDKENINEKKKYLANAESLLNMTDEEVDEGDLSDIIDNIISREPLTKTAKVNKNLVRLVFEKYSSPKKFRNSVLGNIQNNCSTPKDSPIKKNKFNFKYKSNVDSCLNKMNTSYFFDKLTEEGDAFEMSFEFNRKSAVIDLDATEDYGLPEVLM